MRTLYRCKDQFCHHPNPKSITGNVGMVMKEHFTYIKSHNKHIKSISYLKIYNILLYYSKLIKPNNGSKFFIDN